MNTLTMFSKLRFYTQRPARKVELCRENVKWKMKKEKCENYADDVKYKLILQTKLYSVFRNKQFYEGKRGTGKVLFVYLFDLLN